MTSFKVWLEDNQSQKVAELQKIWADTFKALGIGGLSDEDAAQQSLSKITFGQRNQGQVDTFKGKQAARKRLENGQVFMRLEKLADPELKKSVEDAKRWLDQNAPGHEANASTTVSNLLQKLFGPYFQKFIDSDIPKIPEAKAQMQPQPPKETAPDLSQGPENNMAQPQMNATPADQQTQQFKQMQPQQMPPKPPGAEMGLY